MDTINNIVCVCVCVCMVVGGCVCVRVRVVVGVMRRTPLVCQACGR